MSNAIKEVSVSADRKQLAKIIGHVISKGGVGKSTMTTFHAMRLAEQGHSVLVVDIDTQEDFTKFYIPPEHLKKVKRECLSSADLVNAKRRTDTIKVAPSYIENVDVIPADETLLTERNTQIDRSGAGHEGIERQKAVKGWITQTTKDMRAYLRSLPYDYIFLHYSPATTMLQNMFIFCLDVAFIPLENDFREMDMVNKTLTRLKVSRKDFVPTVNAFVYINKYEKPAQYRVNESPLDNSIKRIESTYKSNLIKPFIPLSQTIARASMERRAPWVKAPSGRAHKVGQTVKEAIDKMNSKI